MIESKTTTTPYLKNRFFIATLLLSLFVNGTLWWWLSSELSPEAEAVPLHYTIYFGIDLVGPWWYQFGFPAVGFAAIVVNAALAMVLYGRKQVLAGFLHVVSLGLQILLGLSAYFSVTNV